MESIKNKTAVVVLEGLKRILERAGVAKQIQSDYGREFYNSTMEKYLKEVNVKLFSTNSVIKCSMAERFILTIFGKIQRYFTHNNTRKFVNLLPEFERLYSNSYHRSIGMTPNQVTKETESTVFDKLYNSKVPPMYKKPKFKVGDDILVSRMKKLFDKGYAQTYEENPFTIKRVLNTVPITYIAERDGEELPFYEQELQ